jgi:hypothetical protein
MRGVKRCQASTGRVKKHRYGNEFKVTAVKKAAISHNGKKEGFPRTDIDLPTA